MVEFVSIQIENHFETLENIYSHILDYLLYLIDDYH